MDVPLVPQFVIPWFYKSLLHKRKSNRSLFTANNLIKVFYDVKKSNILNLRQVANIRYYADHSAPLQLVKNLKSFTQQWGDDFKEVCGSYLDNQFSLFNVVA